LGHPQGGSGGPRPPPELVVSIEIPVRPDDIRDLCEALGAALRAGRAAVLVCDVSSATSPDLTVVDALARLALTARRHGRSLVIRRACAELRDLLALAGLPAVAGLGLEAGWQPEQREPPRGVEEERDPGDPIA
jgi:hypothetical protein